MNPNSGNQRWGRWSFIIAPHRRLRAQDFPQVKAALAVFARARFGSATQMRVSVRANSSVLVQVRSEGHPIHDPAYVQQEIRRWSAWATGYFGPTSRTRGLVKFEAGSRQDGRPADQLIIAPPLSL